MKYPELLCAEHIVISGMGMLFFLGFAIGSSFIPILADKQGRKPWLGYSMLVQGITTLATILMPGGDIKWFYVMIAISFISGISAGGRYCIGYCYIMEMAPKSSHFALGTFYNIFDGCFVLLCFTLYFMEISRNWLYPQIYALSIFTLTFTLYVFIIPESPKWLYNNNKVDKFYETIDMMARINGHQQKIDEFSFNEEDEKLNPSRGTFTNTTHSDISPAPSH